MEKCGGVRETCRFGLQIWLDFEVGAHILCLSPPTLSLLASPHLPPPPQVHVTRVNTGEWLRWLLGEPGHEGPHTAHWGVHSTSCVVCGCPWRVLNRAVTLEMCFRETGVFWGCTRGVKLTVAEVSSLGATVSQAGAVGTLALVSHVGYEEQETEVRGFYTVRLLGLSDSLRARLSSVQALYLFSFSSKIQLHLAYNRYFFFNWRSQWLNGREGGVSERRFLVFLSGWMLVDVRWGGEIVKGVHEGGQLRR